MADKFIVQSAIPERLYVKTYHDFLDSNLLSGKEKLVFILLKRYLNFKGDTDGVAGKVYPTLDTLSKQAGMTKKTVADIIKKLEEKGIVEVKQQGLNKPNIYSIRDFSGIWKSKTNDEVRAAIDMFKDEYEESLMIERLREKGYRVVKEKEPDTLSTDQSNNVSSAHFAKSDINNITELDPESQEGERYSLREVRILYDYDVMLADNPSDSKMIDTVVSILYTALNTRKPTIRIGGEDKPSMVVIGRLQKLESEELMYAIGKYEAQTAKIKNPAAYMLTLLYNAKEQMQLDITNQVAHDMENWNK